MFSLFVFKQGHPTSGQAGLHGTHASVVVLVCRMRHALVSAHVEMHALAQQCSRRHAPSVRWVIPVLISTECNPQEHRLLGALGRHGVDATAARLAPRIQRDSVLALAAQHAWVHR